MPGKEEGAPQGGMKNEAWERVGARGGIIIAWRQEYTAIAANFKILWFWPFRFWLATFIISKIIRKILVQVHETIRSGNAYSSFVVSCFSADGLDFSSAQPAARRCCKGSLTAEIGHFGGYALLSLLFTGPGGGLGRWSARAAGGLCSALFSTVSATSCTSILCPAGSPVGPICS